MKTKKAQHEIVGFVLIVVLVMVIGLIFLTFTLGGGETQRKTSAEISDFLQASMYYTSDCAIDNIPNYETLSELIKECYKDNSTDCLDDEDTNICGALNSTLNNVIVDNLEIGYKNKAYELEIYFERKNSTDSNEPILDMSQGVFGNCSSAIGSSYSIPYVTGLKIGNIWVELDICKT